LFFATSLATGIPKIRLKKIYRYYPKNIYIASISIFSIGLYNLDLIFIKIGYDQEAFTSYALGSKLASILIMINSYAYAITPRLIKNKTPLDAFEAIKKLKKKFVLINMAVSPLIALYIIIIYGLSDDVLMIFTIFAISNLINIGLGIRLPMFIHIRSENVLFIISKYFFITTMLLYLFIQVSGISIALTSVLLSSIIALQAYIESTKLKKLMNV
jgi:hypothetical protein